MALVRLSQDYLKDGFTLVDNVFISEYMPYAPELAIQIYLYGLYAINRPEINNNTPESFMEALSVNKEQLYEAYGYLEEKNLIEITSRYPLEIRYLPLKQGARQTKKYKPEKYSEFNRQLQDLFPDRMITPNEYSEYYYEIEVSKMAPEAMLMIVKYCIDYKGESVRYPYILTVARNWANEGILTVDAVEARLMDIEAGSDDMKDLFYALGKKGSPTITDMQEYTKWTKSWGFRKEAVLYAAETMKKRGTITKLDRLLDEYYRMDMFDLKDIESYNEHRKRLYDDAVLINKALGVYYESLDNVVNTYISAWAGKGYDSKTLVTIANYCFKASIRKLEGMNEVINKFYKLGLVSEESIDSYLYNLLKNDERIRAVLEKADIRKSITSSDRSYYKTWTEDWGFSDEIISYVAELSSGRARAFSYINKTLSGLKSAGVKTLKEAKKLLGEPKPTENYKDRTYTKSELNALFDDIDDLGV